MAALRIGALAAIYRGGRPRYLEYDRVPGSPRANDTQTSGCFSKLRGFELDGLFSLSTAPLELWTCVGALYASGASGQDGCILGGRRENSASASS